LKRVVRHLTGETATVATGRKPSTGLKLLRGNNEIVWAYGGNADQPNSPTYSSNTPILLTLRAKNGTAYGRLDGSQATSFSYSSGGQSDANCLLGARNRKDLNSIRKYLDGYLGEVRLYKGLTDSERDSEESDLATKWGIAI